MSNDHQHFYDAKYTAAAQGFSSQFPRQMTFLLRWVGVPTRGLRILDLGGGTGECSLMLQQLGHQVTLFELSEVAVEKARSIGVKSTICGDFMSAPPADKYDVVLVKGFSPLNTDKASEFHGVLSNIERLLAPNGVVLYWGVTDLSGQWTASGWYCWRSADIKGLFDHYLICPALRYQALMPPWLSKVASSWLERRKALQRPMTLVAYKRHGGEGKA